jgi:hypothetical protein
LLSALVALAVVFAQAARADVGDGGAPADAAVTTDAGGGIDAGAPAPALPELSTPPELAPPSTSATVSTPTPLIDTPTPAQAEPPRPITRRLWFWMAITGVIVAAVGVGIAVHNPKVNRPECPQGYECPL